MNRSRRYYRESGFEEALKRYCDAARMPYLKIKLVGFIGFPDRLVLTPSRAVFIELKREEDGKPSVQQEHWIATLNQFTYIRAGFAYTFDEALALIASP